MVREYRKLGGFGQLVDQVFYLGLVIFEDYEVGFRVSYDRGLRIGFLRYTVFRVSGGQFVQLVYFFYEEGWVELAVKGLNFENLLVGGFFYLCFQFVLFGLQELVVGYGVRRYIRLEQ